MSEAVRTAWKEVEEKSFYGLGDNADKVICLHPLRKILDKLESALSAQGGADETVEALDSIIAAVINNSSDGRWFSKNHKEAAEKVIAWINAHGKAESSHAPEGALPSCHVCGETMRVENAEEGSSNDLAKFYFDTPDAEEGDW